MLDGRVLGASQVEYKPFGKPPLQREVLCSVFALSRGAVCSCRCSRCAAYAYGGLALRHLPRLPGIGALPSPRQGRDSSYRGRDSDFALHRGRFSDFAVASDFARKILRKRCAPHRIASGVGFHPENPIAGPAPKVRQRCCPRSIADRVFFHHSHALPSILAWAQDCSTQSCCGNRIATLNPGVGTGLLHPILLWQQDCHTQSWRGHRIAPPNPAVATGLLHPILLWQQDCSTQSCCGNRIAPVFPRKNAGSAVLYSTTPPDSPPGLRGKHRQCVGTHRCTPGLAARIARKTTEAHCCIAGRSRKTPAVRRYTPMH